MSPVTRNCVLAIVLTGLTSAACDARLDPASNCPVDYNATAASPTYGFSVTHTNPARCPVSTPEGGEVKYYSAIVQVNRGYIGNDDLRWVVDNYNFFTVHSGSAFWAPDPLDSSKDRAIPSGYYPAGTVSTPYGAARPYKDRAHNQTTLINGSTADGWVDITYNTPVLAMLGPDASLTGEVISQSISFPGPQPVFPVTYQWYEDGVPAETTNQMTTNFLNAGSHSITVEVTDALGRLERFTKTVAVHRADGCREEPCP
jgi:hypothetical protein